MLKIDLDYDTKDGKTVYLSCNACKQWEPKIKNWQNFLETWVSTGTHLIKKDTVKSHCNSFQHIEAENFQERMKSAVNLTKGLSYPIHLLSVV